VGPVFILILLVCAAPPSSFEVRAMAGVSSGTLMRLVGGTVTLDNGQGVPAGDWYSLRRAPGLLPDRPAQAHLEFGNGDRLVGSVVDGDGSAINLRVGDGQTLRFPLSALRAVWLRPSADQTPDWLAGPRRRDVIQSRSGDIALGVIESIDTRKNVLRYQTDGKNQQTEWARVAAIGFNTDLARVRKPKGPYYRVTLSDGSRLSATSIEFDGTTWTAETLYKGTFRLSPDRVVSVDVEHGKAVNLADLKPAKYEYTPFDGENYGWTADQNVLGRPLRLKLADGEATFDRGLGLHAECTLTYSLGGKYRRFEATAGLDSRDGRLGDAELVIQVDGTNRELPNGGHLSPATGSWALTLDVTGAKEMRITIRKRAGGIVQDVVNLVEAKLIP
jgi:hypothetical protein